MERGGERQGENHQDGGGCGGDGEPEVLEGLRFSGVRQSAEVGDTRGD